ncbi:MAG: iron-sulfur cluster insertion protein ErpA [Geminicoccaceae bacterium]
MTPETPTPFTVTPSAARRINAIVANEEADDLHLRVSVSGGGCSGFQYGFSLASEGEPDDVAVEKDGAKVVVDGMSLMFILGAEIDFVEDLTGSYFRVQNPNATASCGCGNSFAV